jgi:hypothetical protein
MNSMFYLTTVGEYSGLTEPRECRVVDRMKGYNRDDYMLVKIEPVLSGQSFGLGGEDIKFLILSTILKGETLFPIHKWPVCVYVGRIKDKSILTKLAFSIGQVELFAKGFLYQKLDDAIAASNAKS